MTRERNIKIQIEPRKNEQTDKPKKNYDNQQKATHILAFAIISVFYKPTTKPAAFFLVLFCIWNHSK